ncbi:serine O-acetyltransferase EpsC [Methylocapsa palsarum]|uniref:serine O-acetyltransferase n=1 Tax=Methylocapsa palsarum TaxID=1612308 RepID=A0A1I3YQ39_9HYPH|nr:serine O-acetyltransferase EpsC [Methylocapsa palsarum]SFK33905.1 serine O-acetyltransferase [Methylocapsa palsarum]
MIAATKKPEAIPSYGDAKWDIDAIVAELRALRVASLERLKKGHKPPKVPSRKALAGIVEGFSAALFPNRLGPADLGGEGTDFFVGHTLDKALRELVSQVSIEFEFASGADAISAADRGRADDVAHALLHKLPKIRALLDTDIRAAYDGDPAATSLDMVLACYPGVTAMIHHRLAHALYRLGAPLVARLIAEIAHSSTGIDIHPGARIGESFFIDHGTGVVIGETAIIGKGVRLYQAVTLGAKRFAVDEDGALLKGGARHPIVEDGVVIYAGATILGRITIGRGSSIGGNVWLTQSVPPGSNITQAKIRTETFDGGGGI